MKFTKKLFAVALALCLMLCLSIPAFADDAAGDAAESTTKYYDDVTIDLYYKLIGAGDSPAETFTLTQTASTVKDGEAASAPHLGTISGVDVGKGAAKAADKNTVGSFKIKLPTYNNVGVYVYTLKETASNNAGVACYSQNIQLVVTAVNVTNEDKTTSIRVAGVAVYPGGEISDIADADGKFITGAKKISAIENTYSAGALKISKTVKGNLGDKSKYFDFKVTLNGDVNDENKEYADSYAVTNASSGSNNPETISVDGKETIFHLKDGDTISIANLPYGVTYTVTEVSYESEGYKTDVEGASGTIDKAEQTATFTNTKEGKIDMGVTLDNLPYILVLVAVLGGAVVMFTRKRRFED